MQLLLPPLQHAQVQLVVALYLRSKLPCWHTINSNTVSEGGVAYQCSMSIAGSVSFVKLNFVLVFGETSKHHKLVCHEPRAVTGANVSGWVCTLFKVHSYTHQPWQAKQQNQGRRLQQVEVLVGALVAELEQQLQQQQLQQPARMRVLASVCW